MEMWKILISFTFYLFLVVYGVSFSYFLTSDAICDLTMYPDFCKSSLPRNQSTTLKDVGTLFIQNSLLKSTTLLSAINGHLNSQKGLSRTALYALQDCQFLISLNVDFLSEAVANVGSWNIPESSELEEMQTELSATMTYQDTCLDGLLSVDSAVFIANDLSILVDDGCKLCSISLSIFKDTWTPTGHSGVPSYLTEQMFETQDMKFIPSRISSFDKINGRKLLQMGSMRIKVTKSVIVNPNGSGNYTTINEAIAAAPENTEPGKGYFMIYVVAGVYHEYVSISSKKKYLLIVGDGINKTIITGNHSVRDGWTTFHSPTFAVTAKGFVAVNITFQNTAGAEKHQAVALRSDGDMSTFYKCSFEGYQDTLYVHSKRQFYKECDIYGTIDYIFGNGAVVLQNCNIYSRLPLSGQFNSITAQMKSDPKQTTGISIQGCNILADNDLASSKSDIKTYLGRPWKNYSTTVFIQSFMDTLIAPAGWITWSGNSVPTTIYYGEYNNTGPGSITSGRVTWPQYHLINETKAKSFTVSSKFLNGDSWLPFTTVPYIGGLL